VGLLLSVSFCWAGDLSYENLGHLSTQKSNFINCLSDLSSFLRSSSFLKSFEKSYIEPVRKRVCEADSIEKLLAINHENTEKLKSYEDWLSPELKIKIKRNWLLSNLGSLINKKDLNETEKKKLIARICVAKDEASFKSCNEGIKRLENFNDNLDHKKRLALFLVGGTILGVSVTFKIKSFLARWWKSKKEKSKKIVQSTRWMTY
jgi:hypothetical protein